MSSDDAKMDLRKQSFQRGSMKLGFARRDSMDSLPHWNQSSRSIPTVFSDGTERPGSGRPGSSRRMGSRPGSAVHPFSAVLAKKTAPEPQIVAIPQTIFSIRNFIFALGEEIKETPENLVPRLPSMSLSTINTDHTKDSMFSIEIDHAKDPEAALAARLHEGSRVVLGYGPALGEAKGKIGTVEKVWERNGVYWVKVKLEDLNKVINVKIKDLQPMSPRVSARISRAFEEEEEDPEFSEVVGASSRAPTEADRRKLDQLSQNSLRYRFIPGNKGFSSFQTPEKYEVEAGLFDGARPKLPLPNFTPQPKNRAYLQTGSASVKSAPVEQSLQDSETKLEALINDIPSHDEAKRRKSTKRVRFLLPQELKEVGEALFNFFDKDEEGVEVTVLPSEIRTYLNYDTEEEEEETVSKEEFMQAIQDCYESVAITEESQGFEMKESARRARRSLEGCLNVMKEEMQRRLRLEAEEQARQREREKERLEIQRIKQQELRKLEEERQQMESEAKKLQENQKMVSAREAEQREALQKVLAEAQRVAEERQQMVDVQRELNEERRRIAEDRKRVEETRKKIEEEAKKQAEERRRWEEETQKMMLSKINESLQEVKAAQNNTSNVPSLEIDDVVDDEDEEQEEDEENLGMLPEDDDHSHVMLEGLEGVEINDEDEDHQTPLASQASKRVAAEEMETEEGYDTKHSDEEHVVAGHKLDKALKGELTREEISSFPHTIIRGEMFVRAYCYDPRIHNDGGKMGKFDIPPNIIPTLATASTRIHLNDPLNPKHRWATSRPLQFPLERLAAGRSLNLNRRGAPASLQDIVQAWEGPADVLRMLECKSRSDGTGTPGDDHHLEDCIYDSGSNRRGLRVILRGRFRMVRWGDHEEGNDGFQLFINLPTPKETEDPNDMKIPEISKIQVDPVRRTIVQAMGYSKNRASIALHKTGGNLEETLRILRKEVEGKTPRGSGQSFKSRAPLEIPPRNIQSRGSAMSYNSQRPPAPTLPFTAGESYHGANPVSRSQLERRLNKWKRNNARKYARASYMQLKALEAVGKVPYMSFAQFNSHLAQAKRYAKDNPSPSLWKKKFEEVQEAVVGFLADFRDRRGLLREYRRQTVEAALYTWQMEQAVLQSLNQRPALTEEEAKEQREIERKTAKRELHSGMLPPRVSDLVECTKALLKASQQRSERINLIVKTYKLPTRFPVGTHVRVYVHEFGTWKEGIVAAVWEQGYPYKVRLLGQSGPEIFVYDDTAEDIIDLRPPEPTEHDI